VVAPIAYAVRGGQLAVDLWRYKSDRADAAESAARLRAMLAAYLADHGESVWRAARMAAAPVAAAVVPSGRGRPSGHPLPGLVRSCTDVPLVRLSVAPEEAAHVRGVDPRWLRVDGPVAGADVLVVDDTWASGGSAQSAAVALKLAGARRVAIIVIGRHVNPDDPRSAQFLYRVMTPRMILPSSRSW
jgi:orotate phosphoribosyltransferase-like protein